MRNNDALRMPANHSVWDDEHNNPCCVRRNVILLIVDCKTAASEIIIFFIEILDNQFPVIIKINTGILLILFISLLQDLLCQQCIIILAGWEQAGKRNAFSVGKVPSVG